MDGKNTRRGCTETAVAASTSGKPETKQCPYCKGRFQVDQKHPNKKFCSQSHQKLYWAYGSVSIGKVAKRIERDFRKLVEKETKALRVELAALRARLDMGSGESGAVMDISRIVNDQLGRLEFTAHLRNGGDGA